MISKLCSDVCCGGPDNSDIDAGTDKGTDNSTVNTPAGNYTEAADVSTVMDDDHSSASQIGFSVFALLLAKLF